jgi:hypothetical protein
LPSEVATYLWFLGERMNRRFFVRAASLWTQGYADLPGWLSKRSDPNVTIPAAALLPTRVRGRASLLTRILAEVVEQALAAVSAEANRVPIVFGTAFSEMDLTAQLLKMIFEGDGKLSPARFQCSVYNAAVGQVSIATQNRLFSTVLSVGGETFAASLVEAFAWLAAEGGQVLVAVADESPVEALSPTQRFAPLGCALLLSAEPQTDGTAWGTLGNLRCSEAKTHADPQSFLHNNPCSAALPLLEAIGRRRPATVSVSLESAQDWLLDYQPEVAAR